MSKETNEYIEKHYDEMKAALKRLVKHRSVSGAAEGAYPFGKPCADAVAEFVELAEEIGFSARNYDNYAASAQLGENPRVGILGHLDVVPVTEKDWSFPPFSVTEKDGRLYGRGCIDNKGPVVAALFAMKAVKELYPGTGGVRLIVGSTEETGTELDLHHYCEKEKMPPLVFTPDGDFPIITTEKGMIHFAFKKKAALQNILSVKAGTVVNAVPGEAVAKLRGVKPAPADNVGVTCENGVYTVTARGVSAHASKPWEGENALTLLFSYLGGLSLAPGDAELVKAVNSCFPHGDSGGRALGIYEGAGEEATTCVMSMAELSDGEFTGSCDIRPEPGMNSGEICGLLKEKMKYFALSFSLVNETHTVNAESDFVRTLLSAYAEVSGLDPFCKTIGGETYVHNIPGGVAFGAEFPGENNNMHAADEFISEKSFILAAKIYAEAILNLCK